MVSFDLKLSSLIRPNLCIFVFIYFLYFRASLMTQMVKNLSTVCRRPGFNPWVRKNPRSIKWLPTPVLWPGEFHELRSLADYSQQ